MPEPHIEEGQFDDAPEDLVDARPPNAVDPRAGFTFIDEANLDWSDGDEDTDEDEYDLEPEETDSYTRVEDEDWEIAERGTVP